MQANILALFSIISNQLNKHEVFNIACGKQTSLNEIVDLLKIISDKDCDVVYAAPRRGDVLHSKACISKFKNFVGYSPNISINEGLEIVFEWYKNNS